MGELRNGTLIPLFGAAFTNNTGSTITRLDVAYTGEEWRLGTAGRTDQLNLEYSTNAVDLVTGTWTGVPALAFVTPDTATTGAKNGNAAATRTALSAGISGLSIPSGATVWIRWNDVDASGADDGLAVDDFSLTPQGGASATADLAVTKTDDVTTATPGGSVTYTITASNAGPSDAPGASVADTFPAALTATWTCVGAGGGTCTASGAGNINDTVNLPAGASVTYTASAVIASAATGNLSNTATVTAPAGVTDPTPGNNSATDTDTLTRSADLAVTKTDGVSTATPGGSVTYTITASNAGPSDAPGTSVADTFPAALTATWTCVGAGGGTCTASGAGNINDTVNLPAGASVTYTASAVIASAATGNLSNTATVTAPAGVTDPTPGNNSATDTDTLSPALVAPSITSRADATFAVGAPGSFTVTASGNPTPSLSESGTLPAGVSFKDNEDGTATVSGVPATGGVYHLTITASNGVSPNATQSFTLTVQAPPTVTIATPSTGAGYTLGQHVAADFSCSEGAGGPEIKSCLDQNGRPSGAAIDTSTPGQHTYTVTATSDDGQIGQSSATYMVFNPPVTPPAVMRLQAPSLAVLGRTGSPARCRMQSGAIRICTVRLLHGRRVLARGRATASRPGARALTVRLALTRQGRAMLARHLGGVHGRLAAVGTTSGGTRSASARTRRSSRSSTSSPHPARGCPTGPRSRLGAGTSCAPSEPG